MRYGIVVCGGTFDHFHKGHREFLKYALSLGKKVLVGVTSDKYLKSSKLIEDYNTRKRNILTFLKQERALNRVEIRSIDDIYIPRVWESLAIEAIIVSNNTIQGAKEINIKRQEQKKYPLIIKVVPLVKNDNNEYISSSRIRNGRMDKEGKPYLNPIWLKHDLKITEALRKKLKKPFGELIKSEKNLKSLKYLYLITVGDIATASFNRLGFKQNISVIDFHVARKKVFSTIKDLGFSTKQEIIQVNNPAGYLTFEFFKLASKLFKYPEEKQRVVLVEGEEDLCVLPLILAAPLGCVIFYGQPSEGMVKVEVSEESKKRAYQLTSRFKMSS